MSAKTPFASAVLQVVNKYMPVLLTEGKVTSVDKEKMTCEVEREGMADLTGVRLNAILECGTGTITIFPAVQSTVIVGVIENNPADAFVISTSTIDNIVINGGENGGLANVPELKTQLEKLSARVDGIIDAINSSTVIATPQDGGTGLWGLFQKQIATISEKESFDRIEDEKVTH